MVRRSLGVALWSLVGLLACFLGALNGLVGTRAGRSLLARIASNAVERAVSGTIEVSDVRGSLISGVTLTNVRLYDADTSLVASLPRVDLSYNALDFLAGRVVLFEVELDRPVFNIVEHSNGKINLEELLRLDVKDSSPSRGPRTLVLLRNVRITDGTVNLRLQDRPSPATRCSRSTASGPTAGAASGASSTSRRGSPRCGSPRRASAASASTSRVSRSRAATRTSRWRTPRGASRSRAIPSTPIWCGCASPVRSSARAGG